MGAVALAGLGLTPTGSGAAASPAEQGEPDPAAAAPRLTAATFADPPTSVRPKYRWWVPLANTEDAQLEAELRDMKGAGAGGAEVIGFAGSGSGSTSGETFLSENGWGTPKWSRKLDHMIGTAAELDLGLDVTIGPRWPALVPTVTDLNDPRAAKQLAYSSAYVKGGSAYSGSLTAKLNPAPPAASELTLVAALLARCTNADCDTQPNFTRLLERDSVIDVTDQVAADNTLTYEVPGDASQTWTVIGFYQAADGESRSNLTWPTPAYYLDHLSAQGLKATTDYYEANILPTIEDSIAENGRVDLYEDSLELGNSQKWTWDFAEQWEERRGYSPLTVLPALAGAGAQGFTDRPVFDFSDGSGARVRTDYRQTWSDLYIDVRLKPLKAWANSHGMNLRVQPYGKPVDTPEASTVIDVPEGESLAFNHNIENYKLQAVGAHLNKTTVVSNECCAHRDVVWDTRAGGTREPGNLFAAYRSFAGGVTQIVWHGYPYLTQGSPTTSAPGTVWPGMTYGNNTSFAEAFGAKGGPNWQDYRGINDQLARLQMVLRQGAPRFDVAVYWQDFGMSGHGTTGYGDKTMLPSTSALAQRGYTYEYLSPANLAREDATVVDDRLFPGAGDFKVLVLANQRTMSVKAAQRILDLADAGLPVVAVGELPSSTPGAMDAARADADLQALMTELAGKVTRVDSLDALPDALERLTITPDARHASDDSDIVSVRRATADTDYYYLFNQARTAAKQTLTLRGEGRPYLLDTWSGEITALTDYEAVDGGVRLDVSLKGADTRVIALSTRTDDAFGAALRTLAVDDPQTTAAPSAVRIDEWDLAVRSWTPGASGLPGDTAKTDLAPVRVSADAGGDLPAWKDVTPANGHDVDLSDVSGVGTYTSTLTLPDSWAGVEKAWLDLGTAVDTVKLSVNGTELPPVNPQDLGHVEVGRYLRAGENSITARVSSTLLNAVRVAPNTGASGRKRAAYGLLGPVRLVPHGGEQPLLGVEALDEVVPLAEGGANQVRVELSNYSDAPTTVTLATTASDPAVRATADAPTVELAAGQSQVVPVRVHGDLDAGTSTLTVAAEADNGTAGEVEADLVHSRNLALNAVGSRFPRTFASSTQDRYLPEHTTDGDPSTFWVSGGQAAGQAPTPDDPEHLGVDLGMPTRVQAVSLLGRTDYGPRDYDVQVSGDRRSWTTVAAVTDAPKYGKVVSFEPVLARYVRVLIKTGYYTSSPGANTQALELAVYGATRNLALLATPSASSMHTKFNVASANDGWTFSQSDYALWNVGNGWNDNSRATWPDLLTLTWPEPVQLSSARVLTVDNPTNPAATHGLRDYTVQALVDDAWVDVATVAGNTQGTIESTFDTVSTTALRLSITGVNGVNDYSRVVELEAYCQAEDCARADVTPPAVAITPTGTTAGEWLARDATLALTATDDASGVAEVEYRLDSGDWVDYAEPFGLPEGRHRVDVRATDVAGNRSTTRTERFGMDATAPTTTATTAPDPGTPGAVRVTLAATDAASGVAKTWYAVDGAAPVAASGPIKVSGPGRRVVSYWSVDAVGNVEAPKRLPVDVATPPRPAVVRVKLNQRQLRLVSGRAFTLAEGVYYAGGAAPSYSGAVRWVSSNPRVVKVTGDGVLRARRAGKATIRAISRQTSASGRTVSAAIRVRVVAKSPRTKVRRVSAAVPRSMRAGQVDYVTGTYAPARATGVRVTYSSSNPAVAQIDAAGRLLARTPGTVKVTVRAANGSRTFTVTVR